MSFGALIQIRSTVVSAGFSAVVPLSIVSIGGGQFVTAGSDILNTFRQLIVDQTMTVVQSFRSPSLRCGAAWSPNDLLLVDGNQCIKWQRGAGTADSGTVIVSETNIAWAPCVYASQLYMVTKNAGMVWYQRPNSSATGYWLQTRSFQVRSFAVAFAAATCNDAYIYTSTAVSRWVISKHDRATFTVVATADVPVVDTVNGLAWDGRALWIGVSGATFKFYQVEG